MFPHAVGELVNGSPAPFYRVKRVVAPDSEAACYQGRCRHDADGPILVVGGQNRNGGANDCVKVRERWLKASARDRVKMVTNGLSEREDEVLSQKTNDRIIEKGEWIRDGCLRHVPEECEHAFVRRLELRLAGV